ncbi:MAG: hypothetical protein L3J49_08740 [Desulfobulbaceae bacterium]|nr:hypothetical protein [Desulfobulbaceae bacterium]
MLTRQTRWIVLSSIFLFSLWPFLSVPVQADNLLYALDFSRIDRIYPLSWLTDLGFTAEKDMNVPGGIKVTAGDGVLVLQTDNPAFGMLMNKQVHLNNPQTIELQWGVDTYPADSSWRQGVNREAIMVILFFGDQVPADRFFLPDLPRFLGLFLCDEDYGDRTFYGKSYTKTGRYVCVGSPPPNLTIVSNFDIEKNFRRIFHTEQVPPITGIGLEMDTSNLTDGRAAAHIQSLKIFRKEVQTSDN